MSVAPDLLARMLQLPSPQRAELAHHLLLSLEQDPPDPDAASLWDAEIERRAASLDAGTAESSEWHEAVGRIRRNIRRDPRQDSKS